VSATDRTTGRQQSVTIQGGSNLSEQEIEALLAEAEAKAAEDRRKRTAIDRRNRAQTLITQAERRLRDAALELGPYGAERQQRAVELAVRDVQDLLVREDDAELELAASQLQESLFGLNRRLLQERRAESGPLQGLRNTLGSLKDELFSDDDDWDDWNRDSRSDPWASPRERGGSDRSAERYGEGRLGPDRLASDRLGSDRFGSDRFGSDRVDQSGQRERLDDPRSTGAWSGEAAGQDRWGGQRRGDWDALDDSDRWQPSDREERPRAGQRWIDANQDDAWRSQRTEPGLGPEQRGPDTGRRPPVPASREFDSGRGRGFDDDPWRDV